jgi:integrase
MTQQHQGGRPNEGQLILRKSGYVARIWREVDGVRIRQTVKLNTDNKAVARAKLKQLIDDPTSLPTAGNSETFKQAAERIIKRQAADGLKSHKDRLQRVTKFAFPEFGNLPVPAVKLAHIKNALDRALAAGMARRTITHLKIDLSTIFDDLWRDEVIPENLVKKARVPKNAPVDERERIILSDDEFNAFMSCSEASPELRMMALASRTLGGMRTSDLHAWDWSMIDTVNWQGAEVPRPKTRSKTVLTLPDVLVPALKAWHESHGTPAEGAVFPSRHGERAGERKTGKHSYAQALRDALWAAGIVRPLPGFDNAKPDRKLCALQVASTGHKPVDFHSFRRAYNTALATAGVNVQVSMKLAGHKNPSTHMRYVMLAETLTTPEAALPRLTVVNCPAGALAVAPEAVETVKAACVPQLPPSNDTDQKFGINSAPPTGVEPVTFGLGNRCSVL